MPSMSFNSEASDNCKRAIPKGRPNPANNTSHFTLLNSMFFLSCIVTRAAIEVDVKTDKGTATVIGTNSNNNGTESNDPPNPNVDLTNAANPIIIRM